MNEIKFSIAQNPSEWGSPGVVIATIPPGFRITLENSRAMLSASQDVGRELKEGEVKKLLENLGLDGWPEEGASG